jgi:hypothetical protein
MSDKYIATQSKSGILLHLDRCIRRITKSYNFNYHDKNEFILNKYDKIDCRFKTESAIYKKSIANKIIMDSDTWCIYESAIGQVLESISEVNSQIKYNTFNGITGMDFNFCNFNDADDDYDENGQMKNDVLLDEITDRLIEYMCENQYPKEDDIICRYVARHLEKEGYYTKDNSQDAIEVVIDESTENMKSIMKQWANSSERA